VSARAEKSKRRNARYLAGISKAVERDCDEFEALVRARRAALAIEAEQPIVRRDGRRFLLALIALGLVFFALVFLALAGFWL
jgi:hypothetical protein